MSKYYVIDFSIQEVYCCPAFELIESLRPSELLLKFPEEKGNALIYSKQTFNDCFIIQHVVYYIKENIYNIISKECIFNVSKIIDEHKIPNDCVMILKL